MALADIANLIERDLGGLVEAWVQAIRRDESIHSDEDLTEGGLVDHVPHLIEEICAVIRGGRKPSVETTHEARVHAYTRFRQGYRARDLVRETSLLRATLCDHLCAGLSERPDPSHLRSHLEALRTINLYLDEELRYAVSIYTESAQPGPERGAAEAGTVVN